MSDRVYLECSCCGEEGAVSDTAGLFFDGQHLICGCPGLVSVEPDDDTAWINNGDAPCVKCWRAELAQRIVSALHDKFCLRHRDSALNARAVEIVTMVLSDETVFQRKL